MTPTIKDAMAVIRKYAPDFIPKVGMILGSGLSSIAESLTNPITIPYQAFGLNSSAVMGHSSLLVLGYLNNVPVVCLKGRVHLYEGAPYDAIRLIVRLVKNLGAETLIITGASGSLRPEVGAGELMMITDHICLQPGNPLLGPNDESIGPRFVSMEDAYDPYLNDTLAKVAARLNIALAKGVYVSVLGPSFETAAEIRAYQTLGGDCIGMSVAPETIVARHCGLNVVGIAAITNLGVGLSDEKVTHEGTLQYGELTARKLVKLIPEFVKELA